MQDDLIQTCLQVLDIDINDEKYVSRFEDWDYRFLLTALDYIFNWSTSRNSIEFVEGVSYKYLALIFVEQLGRYFRETPNRALNTLYSRLEQLRHEKEQDEEEGFEQTEEEVPAS